MASIRVLAAPLALLPGCVWVDDFDRFAVSGADASAMHDASTSHLGGDAAAMPDEAGPDLDARPSPDAGHDARRDEACPCTLYPNTGCPYLDHCIHTEDLRCSECVASGASRSPGSSCAQQTDCVAGLYCDTEVGVCREYCTRNVEQFCYRPSRDEERVASKCETIGGLPGTSTELIGLCTIECTPFEGNCGASATCRLFAPLYDAVWSDCRAVGTTPVGGVCERAEDCVAGADCYEHVCRAYCVRGYAEPACSNGLVCEVLQLGSEMPFGLCR